MKKFLLATLIGTSLMTTFAGASAAFAEEKTQSVQVNYESIPEIATADYMVAIPQTIKFTKADEGVDLKIELFKRDGSIYGAGDGNGVKIKIESTNLYKLKNGNKELPYSLTYENMVFDAAKTDSEITLNSAKTSITGKAKINATTSIKPGNYSDVLTYTVSPA